MPSATRRLIIVHDDPFRPQPRLGRDADGGMTASVGRMRDDIATKMGAAEGAVLTAVYLVTTGYI